MSFFFVLLFLVRAGAATWVYMDAKRNGCKPLQAIGWMFGVFILTIAFLPLYIILRPRLLYSKQHPRQVMKADALISCKYCGKHYEDIPGYCPDCGRSIGEGEIRTDNLNNDSEQTVEASNHTSVQCTEASPKENQPIPEEYQIYEPRLKVVGIHMRKQHAFEFASSKTRWLEFEPELENRYDPNAIRVIGCSKDTPDTKRQFIGYVPGRCAAAIAHTGLRDRALPRLLRTYVNGREFIDVEFQLLGPKEERSWYISYRLAQPASEIEEELYRFFWGKEIVKKPTVGDVQKLMKELAENDPDKMDEWNTYSEILKKLRNPIFLKEHDLKEPTIAQCINTIQTMQNEGMKLKYLADNPGSVVCKLAEIKPDQRKTI
jgi:hypothetical protein